MIVVQRLPKRISGGPSVVYVDTLATAVEGEVLNWDVLAAAVIVDRFGFLHSVFSSHSGSAY